ncbi:MAG: hypothetical protein BGO55_23575 [Sphingobacteriales bacterium 50-39]|nr:redoxin domain-containing protein [Sphingobacteriales bacterium]OJW58282.1 MAG: hypothetical protein BGO55_23575 [Sphingobacteriales bacterium 50-39]
MTIINRAKNSKHIAAIMSLVLCLLSYYAFASPKNSILIEGKSSTRINVSIYDATTKDTLWAVIYDPCIKDWNDYSLPHMEFFSAMGSDKKYHFDLTNSLKGTGYISLCKGRAFNGLEKYNPILVLYLINPGDNIDITASPLSTKRHGYYFTFEGSGSAKYNCRWQTDTYKRSKDTILSKYKDSMPKKDYEILKCNIEGIEKGGQLRSLSFNDSIPNEEKMKDKIFSEVDTYSPDIVNLSNSYPRYLITKICEKNSLAVTPGFSNKYFQNYLDILSKFSGSLRDKLLFIYFTEYFDYLNDSARVAILHNIDDIYLKHLVTEWDKSSKGSLAYDFSLPNEAGQFIRLSNFKNRVVLLDFYFTGCAACLSYYQRTLCQAEKYYKNNKNIVFIAISIDSNKNLWLKGISESIDNHSPNKEDQHNKYTSRNAINLYTNGNGVTDSAIIHYKVSEFPQPILIDKAGRIFSRDDNELRKGGIDQLKKTIDKALNEEVSKR